MELPPALQNIHFDLKMYTDARFLLEERSFPLVVEEEQKMYIQASVDGGRSKMPFESLFLFSATVPKSHYSPGNHDASHFKKVLFPGRNHPANHWY